MKAIASADEETLAQIKGISRENARKIYEFFRED
ncbi:MAG: hypothetical protein IKL41_03020 [Clostridia bacterium]|nr:hypothetical protein [Clostridia bacterium]